MAERKVQELTVFCAVNTDFTKMTESSQNESLNLKYPLATTTKNPIPLRLPSYYDAKDLIYKSREITFKLMNK